MAAGAAQAAFVGRADELDRLHAALLERAERPGVFIGGEAGIGKTRLLREFAALARAAGATVVVGGCQEVGADSLPLIPFVEALGCLHEELGDRADAVFGPGRAELAILVPALGESPARGDDRVRLYEAVREALDRAGDPTIIILEDLHWADPSSLELLSYLVRRLRHGRTLVVGTFRSDEISTDRSLAPTLAELTRAERCVRIELPPLDRADVAHLVAEIRPHASGSEVDTIAVRSEGNPFFAGELAHAPPDTRDLLPATLRDLLILRIARLSAQARGVVDLLAAIGRPAGPSLLRAAWEGDRDDLDAGLAAALDARVLDTTGSGARTAFHHDLLADAVLVGLRPIERVRLHERLATLLAGRPELAVPTVAGAAAEIARHWVAAECDPQALGASVRAAVAAERIPAWAEALAHYEAAIDAWDRLPGVVVVDGLDHAEALHRAAYAANTLRARDNRRAVELELRAVAALDAEADPVRAAEFWACLSHWYHSGPRDYAASARAAERALSLAPPHPPSRARAAAVASLAQARFTQRRCRETVRLAAEAAEVAATLGDLPTEACARAVLGLGLCDLGRDEEAAASSDRAVEIAWRSNDTMATNVAYGQRLYGLSHRAGAPDDFERAFAAFREAADRLDNLEDVERWWIPPYVVHLSYVTGNWDAVEIGATEMLMRAEPHMTPAAREWQLWMRGSTRVERGRLDEGEDDLRSALGQLGEASTESVAEGRSRLATAALIRRRPDDALAHIEVAAAATDETDYVFVRCMIDAQGVRVAADLAEAGRARRDQAAVIRAEVFGAVRLAHVRAALAGTLVPGMGIGRVVRTLGAWGLAEASRLDQRSDPAAWEDAASLLSAWIEPALLPYARYRQAEAFLAAGDRQAAGPCLRAAHARAVELGAAPLLADIAGLARRGRIDLGDTTRPVSPAVTTPRDPYCLSPREREVLALLVDGRTNREIGSALFISESTASVHVTHILDKLGVNSRGAAVAVAVRAGLVPVGG